MMEGDLVGNLRDLIMYRFVVAFPMLGLIAASGAFAEEMNTIPGETAVEGPTVVTVDPNVRPDFDLSHSLPPAGVDAPRDPWAKEPTIINIDHLTNMKKSDPAPEPQRYPKKLQRMYRHPNPHPAVVAELRPDKVQLSGTGDDVYVNTNGSRYYNVKSRQVFRHSVIVPKEKAEEYGYKPDAYTNPEGNTRETNTPGPTK